MSFLLASAQNPSQNEFLDCSIGQMNNLIKGVASTAGRVMALATVGSHHMCLTAVPMTDVLEAPGSSEGLFGSILSVAQNFKRLKEETSQLSCHLPPTH